MAYCTTCKKSFSEEETVCPVCQTPLSEDFPAEPDEPMELVSCMEDTSLALRFMDFLKENGIHDYTMSESKDKSSMEILVPKKQLERSKKLLNSFLLENTGDIPDFAEEDTPVRAEKSMSERYEDAKSSAMTFLPVGILGLGVSILCMMGIVKLPLSTLSLYVLAAICVAAIIYGAINAACISKYKTNAESENSLMEDCRSWCREHLHADQIDNAIPGVLGEEKEIRYFKRTEYMKSMIHHEFPNLATGLLEEFCDEFYETLFQDF